MKRAIARVFPLTLLLVWGCDGAPDEPDQSVATQLNQVAKAKLQLKDESSTVAQTSTNSWSLTKTGALDPSSSTITWSIAATQNTSGAQRLIVNGRVTVRN